MLQAVCEYLNNYFVRDDEIVEGTFTIADGAISPALSLKEGQRFLVSGSDLNDGIYTWHSDGLMDADDTAGAGLADETFKGTISGLSVPPQVVALAQEISSWVGKYGDAINSPYQSESFGGYSYTRASRNGSGSGSAVSGWQDVFASRLKRWKKVAIL